MKYFLIFVVLFVGCSKNQIEEQQYVEVFEDNQKEYTEVSQFEFEEILGHNAAVAQFGNGDMLIDTSNLKVVNKSLNYDGEESESGYTQGYHRALKQLSDKKNDCTYFH